jgi:hypothetical protein
MRKRADDIYKQASSKPNQIPKESKLLMRPQNVLNSKQIQIQQEKKGSPEGRLMRMLGASPNGKIAKR